MTILHWIRKGVHKKKLECKDEQDFRWHPMQLYPECNGKQLEGLKDRSDSFQFMVLKYDCCVENNLGWGTRIDVGRIIKRPL